MINTAASPDIMLHIFGFIMAGQINRKKRKPLKHKKASSLKTPFQCIVGHIRNERKTGVSLISQMVVGSLLGTKRKTRSYIVPSNDTRKECRRLASDFFSFLKWRMSCHTFPYKVDQRGEINERQALSRTNYA